MKAITLWQPWATLIAIGAKTIETRSWPAPPALYGQRIAIHAASKLPRYHRFGPYTCEPCWTKVNHIADCECDDGISPACTRGSEASWVLTGDPEGAATIDLPLGAIIATARLRACVPMIDVVAGTGPADHDAHQHALYIEPDNISIVDRFAYHDVPGREVSVVDQLPYGSYEPGRWAWLLDDIEELNKPIGFRGRQRVWNWDES